MIHLPAQSFSYGTLGNNNCIYIPPYGLNKNVDYMLKLHPETLEIKKLYISKNNTIQRWTLGIPYKNKIFFLPYGENDILIVDTDHDIVTTIKLNWPINAIDVIGKYVSWHLYNNKIVALPYGENTLFNLAICIDVETYEYKFINIDVPNNDLKKWHKTQLIDNIIYGVPRGERWENNYFSHSIEFNCDTLHYSLYDLSHLWNNINSQPNTNKKYTTLAKANNILYAPPYSENPNFDLLLKRKDDKWSTTSLNLKSTSRKYFSHIVAKNNKIYFPPAGHDETWSEMLVIDSINDMWKVINLNLGKESKKYFAGQENSKEKIYFIPRGGCVCEPEDQWKLQGDLSEILVVNTKDDSYYTIDISNTFIDATTIEKYNQCLIYNDVIFAFPYGESESFHKLLVFDTISEKIVKVIDLGSI
jgi:hypothetical protein